MKRSIDDLGEKLQTKKPVFLSKAEREQLALKRGQEEFEEQQPQQSNPNSSSSSSKQPSSDDVTREQRRDRRDRVREEESKIMEKDGIIEKQAKKRETEEEVESIKEQYFRTKKWRLQMESYETFACPCGRGDVVERTSHKSHSYGRLYYACPFSKPKQKKNGCGYFEWKDEHQLGSPGPSTPSSSFSGLSGSAPSHENAECSNCKILAMQKKILEAALDMERHPENHTCRSVAIVHELLNDMENLV